MLSLKITLVIRTASPFFAAGPHRAIICASSGPLGVTTPFRSFNPSLPIGKGERTYTSSAFTSRTRSMRVCFDIRGGFPFDGLGAESLSPAEATARRANKVNNKAGRRYFMEHPESRSAAYYRPPFRGCYRGKNVAKKPFCWFDGPRRTKECRSSKEGRVLARRGF